MMVVLHFSAVIASLFVLRLQKDPFLLVDAFLVRKEILFYPLPRKVSPPQLVALLLHKAVESLLWGRIWLNPPCHVTMASLLNCSRDACVTTQDLQHKWTVLAVHSFMACESRSRDILHEAVFMQGRIWAI